MSENSIIEMPQIHAHVCERCLSEGVETVWIHQDIKRGDIQAHKCPKCGTVQWKKFMVPVGQLPQHGNANRAVNMIPLEAVNSILIFSFYILAIVAIFFLVYMRIKGSKTA